MLLLSILAIWLPATFVAAQTARFTNPTFSGVTVGEPFTITWEPASAVVNIKLKTGPSTAQSLVTTIVSGAIGGSFTWIPGADTTPGQLYNLEIDEGSSPPNYSVQFTIAGGSRPTGTSSEVASPMATSTSAVLATTASSSTPSSTISVSLRSISSNALPITPSSASSFASISISDSSSSITQSSISSVATISISDSGPSLSTSTSSNTSTPQPSINSGLSVGAKAGIGVGVVLAACITLSGVWFCFGWKKRRRLQTQNDLERRDSLSAEKGHELMTTANAHEMEGKLSAAAQIIEKELGATCAELNAQGASPASRTAELVDEEARVQATELYTQQAASIVPELDSKDENKRTLKVIPSESQINTNKTAAATNVGSSWEHFQPSELDGNAIIPPVSEFSAASLTAPLHNLTTTSMDHGGAPISEPAAEPLNTSPSSPSVPPIASASTIVTDSPGEDKLESLQKRINQVREDKERLEKIQQLKELEAELQREILAERNRREGGPVG